MARKTTRKTKTAKKKGTMRKAKRSTGYTFSVSASDRKRLNNVLLKLEKNISNTIKLFNETLSVLAKW